jgi:hypothetical protein
MSLMSAKSRAGGCAMSAERLTSRMLGILKQIRAEFAAGWAGMSSRDCGSTKARTCTLQYGCDIRPPGRVTAGTIPLRIHT